MSFHSRRRPIVFPQADHARLASVFAYAWEGPPQLPFASFVRGVADHDRGYGERDDDAIGGDMTSEHWVGIQRRGYLPRGEDPVVDLVAALHVRRLLSSQDDEYERVAFGEVDALVPQLLEWSGVSREQADAADAITNVCDVISFQFCFEAPSERDVRGYHVTTDGEGGINVAPWPFRMPKLLGVAIAYQLDRYPERIVPVVVPFSASPL